MPRPHTKFLTVPGAGYHTKPNLVVPPGMRLVYQPAYTPEVQPAEHLWPVLDEPIVNRYFETLEELEPVLEKRCRGLDQQRKAVAANTSFAGWPKPVVLDRPMGGTGWPVRSARSLSSLAKALSAAGLRLRNRALWLWRGGIRLKWSRRAAMSLRAARRMRCPRDRCSCARSRRGRSVRAAPSSSCRQSVSRSGRQGAFSDAAPCSSPCDDRTNARENDRHARRGMRLKRTGTPIKRAPTPFEIGNVLPPSYRPGPSVREPGRSAMAITSGLQV